MAATYYACDDCGGETQDDGFFQGKRYDSCAKREHGRDSRIAVFRIEIRKQSSKMASDNERQQHQTYDITFTQHYQR